MNTWETYRDLAAPAGVLAADPDWLALQYTPPFTPPLDKVLDFPRALPGASVIAVRNVRLTALPVAADGSKLAPSGTLTLQVLEVVPGVAGPVLIEVTAAVVVQVGVDTDLGLSPYGTGDYVLRATAAAGLPAGTESLHLVRKAIG